METLNDIKSQRLNEIEKLTREFKITPLYECLIQMIKSGELEKEPKPLEENIHKMLMAIKKRRNDTTIEKVTKSLGIHYKDANVNNILWNVGRKGINKKDIQELSTNNWIRCKRNIILMGPTGVGKTRIADSLVNCAIREKFKVFYRRGVMLATELGQLEGSSEILAFINHIKKFDLIYIDDFASGVINSDIEAMLGEIADDIVDKHCASMLITTQHTPESWITNYFHSPAVGESFVDRVFAPAIKFDLTGPSLRVKKVIDDKTTNSQNNGMEENGTEDGTEDSTKNEGSHFYQDSSTILVPSAGDNLSSQTAEVTGSAENGTKIVNGTVPLSTNDGTVPKVPLTEGEKNESR